MKLCVCEVKQGQSVRDLKEFVIRNPVQASIALVTLVLSLLVTAVVCARKCGSTEKKSDPTSPPSKTSMAVHHVLSLIHLFSMSG